ncbi:hypothetical protein AB205_0023460 [Aquarana catesbeiana]|uniref:CYRIA/CYRIB Rac1 binding domain-containing protein n=1 Tax=Aquarana catesbeiana TaxID=8400 RepID=A0A2G9SAY3_AQUCT|nr:hypothetical protein AB205_0023460 [Aquarana catesbeiana]
MGEAAVISEGKRTRKMLQDACRSLSLCPMIPNVPANWMKGCIKVLKDQPSTSTEGLLNALRYTTRHLNDDTTSKQIRALLQ